MADLHSIALKSLCTQLSDEWGLRERARQLGVVVRQSKVDSYALLASVVLGVAVRGPMGIASIGRILSDVLGHRLARSSVWARFTPAFRDLVREVLDRSVRTARERTCRPSGVLSGFKDVLAVDATVVRVHDSLEGCYRATRRNSMKAALKVHTWVRALTGELVKYKITADAHGDGKAFGVDHELRGTLVLFDRGYSSQSLWLRIHNIGGYFLTPLPADRNPEITGSHRRHRGAARKVTGRRLKDVLNGLQRAIMDVKGSFRCKVRKYGTEQDRVEIHEFRIIAIRTKRGKYRLYVTNAPVELLPAEVVSDAYRLRWEVETFYKTAKSGSGLNELSSAKQHIVETMVYAALLRATASMTALAATRARLVLMGNYRINPGQWHKWYIGEVQSLLRSLVKPCRAMTGAARLMMLTDPNRSRSPTRERIQLPDLWGECVGIS